jgi:hypothetical protein
LAVSRKLVDFQPLLLAYRTTLALAYLRSNDPASAKAVYAGLEADWATVLPGWQAVYTAVLGATDEPEAARTLARRIPVQRLKPEERALIEPWLAASATGG